MRITPFVLLALAHATALGQVQLLGVDGSNLVKIDPATATVTVLGAITPASGTIGITGALAYDAATDTLYLSSTSNDNLWKLDYNTRIATLIGAYNVSATIVMHGLEWDSGNGKMYGFSTNLSPATTGHRFFEVNPATGQATGISTPNFGGFGSLGYVRATDTMYLADTTSTGRSLYKINVITGEANLVGQFGVNNQVGVGLAYHPNFGMIACNNSGTNALYRIDLSTGAANLIGNLSTSNLLSLAFVGHDAPTCYPNCDGSTASPTLTANDFQCFLNAYAGGDSYANCDGSTSTPTLTANDFQCFLNSYASGCS